MTQRTPYHEGHDLFVDALLSAPDDAPVPACPSWDVHDLLAHQVLQLEAAHDGTFPFEDAMSAIVAPTPEERVQALQRQERWIATGVARARSAARDGLLARWGDLTDNAVPQALGGLFPDLAVHLYDLLGALHSTQHRHHDLIAAALEFWTPFAIERVRLDTGCNIRVDIADPREGRSRQRDCLDGDVIVTASAFELLRVVTGRRARSQAAGVLQWSVLDDRIVAALPLYGWRAAPLNE